MEFRTVVDVGKAGFEIAPCETMLFVGSCFADRIGKRFVENGFPATVNPFGVMYNPASVLDSVRRWEGRADTVFLTYGTNHVYRLKETGEIVDNCRKRPQSLFTEEELSVEQCADYMRQTVELLRERNPQVKIVMTVSPIRYRKYGYHESQLSKATLLLAVNCQLSIINCQLSIINCQLSYFPAYEIMMDELRDYRFYEEDMLHPTEQAVSYIWQRLDDFCFSDATRTFLAEWAPLKAALAHRPFDAESKEYREFLDKTMLKVTELRKKYPTFALPNE